MSRLRNTTSWFRRLPLSPAASFKLSLCCLFGFAALLFLLAFYRVQSASAQNVDRAQLLQEIIGLQNQIKNTTDPAQITTLKQQLHQKEELFLAPAPEDFVAFADFLRQPNTGLLRLMPREQFRNTLSTIREGGAYFSFVSQVHAYGFGSDVGLEQGYLKVGFAGADFGYLTSLGNTSLDGITVDTSGVASLAAFTPPLAEPGARQQQTLSGTGFQEGSFFYINRLTASLGTTYVIRSVSYSRSDTLVGIRLFRRDTDGSLIIPWKLLRRYATPQLNGASIATASAASYAPSDFTPGSIASAFCPNIVPGNFSATGLPLPISLGGARVSIQDSSERQFQLSARLFAAAPGQINYLIPLEAVEGYGLVTVRTSTDMSYTELIRITKTAPGLFTANSDGQGVPAAVAFRRRGLIETYETIARFDNAQNKFVTTPIDLGPDLGSASDQVALMLFGTGIGPHSDLSTVSAKIGGVDAPVLYAGAQGALGLDQVNVLLPRSLVGRGEVDLVLTVDGQTANTVRVNIK